MPKFFDQDLLSDQTPSNKPSIPAEVGKDLTDEQPLPSQLSWPQPPEHTNLPSFEPEMSHHHPEPELEKTAPVNNSWQQPIPERLSEPELPSPLQTPELPPPLDQDDQQADVDPVRTLITWNAPARPFRKKDRSFYTTATVLVVLVSLIALLMGQVMLVGVLLALLFLIYVLNFIPPEDVDYKISTQGVTVGGHFYHFKDLDSFWFSEKDGFQVLNILTNIRFPSMLMLVLKGVDEEQVKKTVARYLPFHEIAPKSLLDRWSEGLQKHFPLENPHR